MYKDCPMTQLMDMWTDTQFCEALRKDDEFCRSFDTRPTVQYLATICPVFQGDLFLTDLRTVVKKCYSLNNNADLTLGVHTENACMLTETSFKSLYLTLLDLSQGKQIYSIEEL